MLPAAAAAAAAQILKATPSPTERLTTPFMTAFEFYLLCTSHAEKFYRNHSTTAGVDGTEYNPTGVNQIQHNKARC